MRFYFAYGANMDVAGMARRCPEALALGPARLDDRRFAIVHPGYATVIAAKGSCVHGVLWRLGSRDLVALDAFENIASGLYLRADMQIRQAARSLRALTYFVREPRPGRVRPGYLEDCVLPAARHWGLPANYISSIEAFRVAPGTREPWRDTSPP